MASSFNGWGIDFYDALDTMILMNTTEEFDRAMFNIQQADFYLPPVRFLHLRGSYPVHRLNMHIEQERNALFFETVIRHLGGLLSAYAMTGHELLLEKADLLGRLLSPVFETRSGLPYYDVNTVTYVYLSYPTLVILKNISLFRHRGETRRNPDGYLAELASCQPEYTYLAKITGKPEYYNHVSPQSIQSLRFMPHQKPTSVSLLILNARIV